MKKQIEKEKMPAGNMRFGATAAVTPQNVWCRLER